MWCVWSATTGLWQSAGGLTTTTKNNCRGKCLTRRLVMAEKLTWDIEAKDRATSALREVQRAADGMRESLEEAGKRGQESMDGASTALDATTVSAGKATGAGQSMFGAFLAGGPHVMALNQALELTSKIAGAAAAAFGQMRDVMHEAMDAWRVQRNSLLELEAAFRQAGASGAALTRQMEWAQEVSGKL